MAAGSKVMLVEDDPNMQAVLRTLLEIEGFEVSIAPDRKSIAEILQAIQVEAPNAILLDVHLRHASGLDIMRRVREEPAISQTWVVMCSGMDVEDQCMAAGADSFIMKPYMPDELIQKLRG